MSTVRFHQGFAGAGVFQLGEFPQHVGHLIAPLAAADINHDFHIGPFGQLMLYHGLAGAEGTGYRGGAAFGDGEQGVDNPLPRHHRRSGRGLLFVGTAHTNRPFLHQRQLF